MPDWVAISKSQHFHSSWRRRDHFNMFSNEVVAAVLPGELGKLIAEYVLGFIQTGETFRAVAILGMEQNKNLYVSKEGKWLALYVPAVFRSFPFALAQGEDDNRILCVDKSHISEDAEDSRFFDEEGNLTEVTSEILTFLQKREQELVTADKAAQLIAEQELLKEWPLSIATGEDLLPFRVEGLFRIDEEKLNRLEAVELGELRQCGALPLAYAQLLSMSQTDQLSRRLEYQRDESGTKQDVADLGELLSADDALNFDSL
ncbi:MAG: SapC family protein [Gammaproteobacteria bacterium]